LLARGTCPIDGRRPAPGSALARLTGPMPPHTIPSLRPSLRGRTTKAASRFLRQPNASGPTPSPRRATTAPAPTLAQRPGPDPPRHRRNWTSPPPPARLAGAFHLGRPARKAVPLGLLPREGLGPRSPLLRQSARARQHQQTKGQGKARRGPNSLRAINPLALAANARSWRWAIAKADLLRPVLRLTVSSSCRWSRGMRLRRALAVEGVVAWRFVGG